MRCSQHFAQQALLIGALAAVLALGCEQSTGASAGTPGGSSDTGTLDDAKPAEDAAASGDTASTDDTAASDTAQTQDGTVAADTTVADATPDVPSACPAQAPIGATCDTPNLQCQFGQECCCGKCFPSMVCSCNGGSWGCYATDACMLPPGSCADAGGGDGSSDGGSATDGGASGKPCTDSTQCPPDLYCQQAAGQCGGAGACTLKPTGCTKEYAPVCGCDGQTYGNACEAASKAISIKMSGICGASGGCDIATQTGCATGEYCSAPVGTCKGTGTCAKKPEMCTMEYAPVCGCNGKTFSNVCAAAGNGQVIASTGECPPAPAGCDAAKQTGCAADQYCKSSGPGVCSGPGTCTAKPQACPAIYSPMCGCDGKTYGNECEAAGAGQNVATKGACAPAADLKWYKTCGDPVCKGWSGKSGYPLCTTEGEGGSCAKSGDLCDPQDGCNALLKCTDVDPKAGFGCPISRAKYKSDIRYVAGEESRALADRLLSTRLATYRYTATGPQGKRQLGFIIDDDPSSPAIDAQRDMVDLYGYLSMAVATLQVQQQKIDTLQHEVESLRAGVCGAPGTMMSR